jgi:phospholipid-binding lipoprotein MlaA
MNLTLLTAALLSTSSPDAIVVDPELTAGQATTPAEQSEPEEGAAPPVAAPPASDTAAQTAEDEPVKGQEPEDNAIVVTGTAEAPHGDPLANINASSFEITQGVDRAVVEPIATVYRDDFPKPLRKGLKNFFRNLLEPIVFLNYLLQLKPGKAFETLGRFGVNSTLGLAGLFDVAKKEPFNLPYRRNGLANTLGYYGVGPGPFLVLPLVGATTLRDFLGGLADVSVLPTAVGKPFSSLKYSIPAYTVNSLEFRIEFDERLVAIRAADDPYTALREIYLCQREADIAALKNRAPERDCSPAALFAVDDADDIDEDTPDGIEPQPDIDTASDTVSAAPPVETAPAQQGEETIIPADEEVLATPR